jgi:hypothetical protein
MTATSAWSASNANPFPPTSPPTPPPAPSLAHVRIPGSARTYEVRDVLRGLGLRWDPVSHAWHGTLPLEKGTLLTRQLGLRPQIVPTIDTFDGGEKEAPRSAAPRPPMRPPAHPSRPHDGRATRAEARVALRDVDEDAEEFPSATRTFSVWDVTSGLLDDSREADERAAARALRDLLARVKAARAVVSTTPGLAAILASDWRKAARFYARFDVTEATFQCGVRANGVEDESRFE